MRWLCTSWRCIIGEHAEEELNWRSGTRGVVMVGAGAVYSVCEESVRQRRGTTRGCRGAGTHRDERERATRVDRDAPRFVELGACAFAVEVASSAATGECGDVIGGEVETADIVGVVVLRCIMGNT